MKEKKTFLPVFYSIKVGKEEKKRAKELHILSKLTGNV